MRVLGIDPGVTGAWAVIDCQPDSKGVPPEVLQIGDLPVKTIRMSRRDTKRLDVAGLENLFLDLLAPGLGVDRVFVERLTGAPGITSTTAFSLGWTAGVLDTVLTNHGWKDYKSCHPSAWKRALLVPADKSAAKARATKLFRSDKHWPKEKDHNRAEAALIALYGALSKG
jgi:hypothetical protein